jgi:hypothetical protein
MAEVKSVFGKDMHHENIADYTGDDAFKKQKDSRVVKFLMFPFMVESPNPTHSGGEPVLKERVGKQNEVISIEELGPLALERGERLGAFYTDAELAGATPEQIEAGEAEPVNFAEWGVPELTEYIEKNQPNIADTVAMAQEDPEAAGRVLEAETAATDGDPRSGVVKGLQKVQAGDN